MPSDEVKKMREALKVEAEKLSDPNEDPPVKNIGVDLPVSPEGVERKVKALWGDAVKGVKIIKCPVCEKDVRDSDTFCWNCGRVVKGEYLVRCQGCNRLFKTIKPLERTLCNECEKEGKLSITGLLRYRR